MPEINLIPQKEKQNFRDYLTDFYETSGRSLFVGGALVVASLIIYLGLVGTTIYLNHQIGGVKNQMNNLQSQEDFKTLTDISNFSTRISSLSSILSGRTYFSRVFYFISRITLPQVYYSSFSGDTGGTLSVKAHTDSYSSLAKELVLLYGNSQIKQVNVSSISMNDKGGIDFSLDMKLDPSIFTNSLSESNSELNSISSRNSSSPAINQIATTSQNATASAQASSQPTNESYNLFVSQ